MSCFDACLECQVTGWWSKNMHAKSIIFGKKTLFTRWIQTRDLLNASQLHYPLSYICAVVFNVMLLKFSPLLCLQPTSWSPHLFNLRCMTTLSVWWPPRHPVRSVQAKRLSAFPGNLLYRLCWDAIFIYSPLHAASDTLPTAVNLRCWHIQCDVKCPLCNWTSPTTAHVLSGCPVALSQDRYKYNLVYITCSVNVACYILLLCVAEEDKVQLWYFLSCHSQQPAT